MACAATILFAAACASAALQAASGARLIMPLGWGVTRVLSGSMEPTFSAGSFLLVREVRDCDTVHVGDIVVYDAGGGLVAHRVVEAGASEIVARGDANNVADAPIPRSQVKGTVVAWTPGIPAGRMAGALVPASARCAAAAYGQDAAQVAYFGWGCSAYVSKDSRADFASERECAFDFVVSNVRCGRVSEVSQTCRFEVWAEGGLPLEVTLRDSETSAVVGSFSTRGGGAPYTFSPASAHFVAAEDARRSYRLEVAWPEDGGAGGPVNSDDVVYVAVVFEQEGPGWKADSPATDPAEPPLVAQVDAKYLHRETFSLPLASL